MLGPTCSYQRTDCLVFFSLQSFEQNGQSQDGDLGQIQKAASAVVAALSKRHNSTVMLAVVEVKVETVVKSPPAGEFCLLLCAYPSVVSLSVPCL